MFVNTAASASTYTMGNKGNSGHRYGSLTVLTGKRRRNTKIDATASVSKLIAPNIAKSVITSNGGLPSGKLKSIDVPAISRTLSQLVVIRPTTSTIRIDQPARTVSASAGVA